MEPKSFCFFAHVDSGKSTVAGHLLYQMSFVNEHEFNKLKIECEKDKAVYQLYSRILDINEEERQKGKTHEYNIVDFDFGDQKFQLIDTPGHKNYIREMINGLSHFESQRIIGCFLLSAKKGEFESGWIRGQSKEHLIIARSLGIKDLIVLVNKMDLVEWSEEEFNRIKKESEPYIKNVCGFKNYTYVPISGYQGQGLTTLPPCEWYQGKCLMDTLKDLKIEKKDVVKELEMREFSKLIAKVKIIHCENIITIGYTCMIHYCGEEYECEIVKMDKKFLKQRESSNCLMICKERIKSHYLSRRFLIRSKLNTIGFGEILKVAKTDI
jgi:elongation factor 1-alpha